MKEKGVSQSELVDRTGINQPVLSRYQTGKEQPGYRNLIRIAEGLECTTTDLTGV